MSFPILLIAILPLLINPGESSLEVHLDANNHLPTHIGEDIALSLKCSFFSNDTHDDFQSIYEISICEVDQDKETKLATFNALVHDILLFIDNASTKVEGKAYTINGYLKIDTTADEATSQNFSCVVKYLDKTLGFKTLTTRASIKGNNIFTLLTEKITANKERFLTIERNLTGLEVRLSAVEVQMSIVNSKLSNIDKTLTKFNSTIGRVLTVTKETQKKFDRSESNFNNSLSSLRDFAEANRKKIDSSESNINISLSILENITERNREKIKYYHKESPCNGLSNILVTCNNNEILMGRTICVDDDASYLCDTNTDNGGWTVFQRRFDGKQDFYQNWTMYEQGFGDLHNDFWLGLIKIRNLVKDKPHELRVDLVYQGNPYYAHYKSFEILDASNNYRLLVSGYDGTAGDALAYHNNMPFSTFDNDNDENNENCAVNGLGAWWYKLCHTANLNGRWGIQSSKGLMWSPTIFRDSATFTEMKMRPTT